MPRRAAEDARQTRERVLSTAIRQFAERGIAATTLEQVAAEAGVSRGAVYWHFEHKEALVREAMQRLRWPIQLPQDPADYQRRAAPLEQLAATLVQQSRRCMADPVQWSLVRLALRRGDPDGLPREDRRRVDWEFRRTSLGLACVMRIAQAKGQLRAGLKPLDAGHGLHLAVTGLLLACGNGRLHGGRLLLPTCIGVFIDGLRASPDRA